MVDRRIIYDNEDKQMYDGLLNSSTPFKKFSITDIFAIAIIYGKKMGLRTPLGEGMIGRVRESTIDNSNIRYLMMAIAADEEKSIDVVADINEYFKICEEYAKTGISLLNSDALSRKNKILYDMEDELLEFIENNNIELEE